MQMSIGLIAEEAEGYKKDCDSGNIKTCVHLGRMYYLGKGVQQNYSKAIELFTKACDTEDYASCLVVGAMYAESQGVEKNDIRAVEFYTKACKGKEAAACYFLGSRYFEGKGVKQNISKAFEFYTKACDMKKYIACYDLGEMYKNDNGENHNYSRALEFHTKGCEGGEFSSCNSLGAMYGLGQGVEQNDYKSAMFYAKSCDAGYAMACSNLGGMYYTGEGVEENISKAQELSLRGCEAGDALGCNNLRIILKREKNQHNEKKEQDQQKEAGQAHKGSIAASLGLEISPLCLSDDVQETLRNILRERWGELFLRTAFPLFTRVTQVPMGNYQELFEKTEKIIREMPLDRFKKDKRKGVLAILKNLENGMDGIVFSVIRTKSIENDIRKRTCEAQAESPLIKPQSITYEVQYADDGSKIVSLVNDSFGDSFFD